MSFNSSNSSRSNVILNVDEPRRSMTGTNALNESSYQTAKAWRDIFVQWAELIQAWTQALKDHDGEDISNVDKDAEIEDE